MSCHVSAWMVALQEERRRFGWQGMARRALLGSADEVVLEAQKGLEAQSAMADVSLAAMAGVTAADHERSSKSYLVKSRVWA